MSDLSNQKLDECAGGGAGWGEGRGGGPTGVPILLMNLGVGFVMSRTGKRDVGRDTERDNERDAERDREKEREREGRGKGRRKESARINQRRGVEEKHRERGESRSRKQTPRTSWDDLDHADRFLNVIYAQSGLIFPALCAFLQPVPEDMRLEMVTEMKIQTGNFQCLFSNELLKKRSGTFEADSNFHFNFRFESHLFGNSCTTLFCIE